MFNKPILETWTCEGFHGHHSKDYVYLENTIQ